MTEIIEVCIHCLKRTATKKGVFCDVCREELRKKGVPVKSKC